MWLQKKFSLILSISFFLQISCSQHSKKVSEVIESFPDGTVKVEQHYTVSGSDTISVDLLEYHPDGALKMRGPLDDEGKRHGMWEAFYPDSTLWSKGNYTHGLADGSRTVWYPNGQKRFEGEYLKGKEVGLWKFWDEQGKLLKTHKQEEE